MPDKASVEFDVRPGSPSWGRVTRAVLLHAHPDDETLSTGALVVDLVARGIDVGLVTATRGERGEVAAASLSGLAGTPDLAAHRERELAFACAALGIDEHVFLGQPPARAWGLPPRVYRDSGMRWVTPTLAGPAQDVGPDAFTMAGAGEPAADLAAYLRSVRADVLLSYDEDGGYGHPDHVACHTIAETAAGTAHIPFVRVVSPTRRDPPDPSQAVWSSPQYLEAVREALAYHASQLTVVGHEIVHSGGQHQPIGTEVVLASVG